MARQGARHSLILALIASVVLGLTLALAFSSQGGTSLADRYDEPLQDFLVRLRNQLKPATARPISSDVALIGIDDSTAKALGPYGRGGWWVRKPFLEQLPVYQQLIKPSVLAFDILFKEISGEEQHGAGSILQNQEALARLIGSLQRLAGGEDSESDVPTLMVMVRLLIELGNFSLATGFSTLDFDGGQGTAVILGYYLDDLRDPSKTWPIEAIIDAEGSEDGGSELPYLRDFHIPLALVHQIPEDYPWYLRADLPTNVFLDYTTLGFINAAREHDGTVRRAPVVQGIRYSYEHPQTGKLIERRFFLPSIALLSCLYHWGIDLRQLHRDGTLAPEGGQPVIEVWLGDRVEVRRPDGQVMRIPVDSQGRLYLDFVGRLNEFQTVPFHRTIPDADGKVNAEVKKRLDRKISFVGITATGTTDVGPTPLDPHTPFVLVHMIAASNMLTGTFTQPLGGTGKLAICLALWLLLTPLAIWLRTLRFGLATALILVGYLGLAFMGVYQHQALLPLVAPLSFILVTFVGVVLFQYFTESRERQKIRDMFSTMVSGEILQYMEDNPSSFSLAGERREATMFFSDVAGFTTISESLPPERLVELLNQYLSPMTEIIRNSQGFVDKYEGDAIMAEWGVPYPNPDHARLACWAALDQQAHLAEIRPRLLKEFGHVIQVRMGLNSGVVSAGNMGSTKRMSYTVMGDAVNQAARFEPANKDYGTYIMIGESTYALAQAHIEARLLDRIIVKGKTKPIQIYELLAKAGQLEPVMAQVMAHYQRGLERHWERRWEEAIAAFDEALKLRPDDGPSQALRNRVQHYQHSPPGPEWLGEYVRATKD